jgi:hypothetical protein
MHIEGSPRQATCTTFEVKGRAARRAQSRGAVMFIVAMTLTVIAAMGMYALNIAATEVKTAGYVREQTQVHYLSEFGVLGAAQDVAGPKAQLYRDLMLASPDTNCTSLWNIPTTAGRLPLACRVLGSTELAAAWGPPVTPIVAPWQNGTSETTRGSEGLPTAPDFYIEVTDMTTKNTPAGFGTNQGLCFIEFTVTSVGLSQLTLNSYKSEGLEMSRARIVGGPIKCAGGN